MSESEKKADRESVRVCKWCRRQINPCNCKYQSNCRGYIHIKEIKLWDFHHCDGTSQHVAEPRLEPTEPSGGPQATAGSIPVIIRRVCSEWQAMVLNTESGAIPSKKRMAEIIGYVQDTIEFEINKAELAAVGNPVDESHCDISGVCTAPVGSHGTANCIYCGKELTERGGKWYTWDADLLTKTPKAQASAPLSNEQSPVNPFTAEPLEDSYSRDLPVPQMGEVARNIVWEKSRMAETEQLRLKLLAAESQVAVLRETLQIVHAELQDIPSALQIRVRIRAALTPSPESTESNSKEKP